MTPREPDRYDKQGEELACAYRTVRCPDRATLARQIAAALRAAESSALERAAQECDEHAEYFAAGRIRALIPPAAAPAALESMCDCGKHVEGEKYALPAGGHVRAAHVAAPATERQTCVPCQGTGRRTGGGGWGLCPDCNGHGTVVVARAAPTEGKGK